MEPETPAWTAGHHFLNPPHLLDAAAPHAGPIRTTQ